MAAELEHPGRLVRWLPQERDVELILAEYRAAPLAADLQLFVRFHDLLNLLIAFATERRGQHVHRRGSLGGTQPAELETGSAVDGRGKVGPASALRRVIEGEENAVPLLLIERR